jgi:hypothetical protein
MELYSKKALFMPMVNSWEDVYENFFLKCNFTCDGYEVAGFKEDSKNYFGQCWTLIEDSDAMWRIYSQDKQCVRIKTTIKKLFNSLIACSFIQHERFVGLINDTFIGKVVYKSNEELNLWMNEQKISRSNSMPNIIESLYIKRDHFQHEAEVRVIYYADEKDNKLVSNVNPPLVSFTIDPSYLIDEIAFDPRGEDSYISYCKSSLMKEFSISENKIKKSKLYDFDPFTFNII